MGNGEYVSISPINKACPKDSFPLPIIDQLVDLAAIHEIMSFLDPYSGYYQIPLFDPDQENMAFITTMDCIAIK